MGCMDAAIAMIDEAKKADADVIKFQHHLPDEEMLPETPMSDNFTEPLYEFLIKHALTISDHSRLKRHCDEKDIKYLCTPFSYKAAVQLNEIGVDAFKIGSGEMTDLPSLEKIAGLNKPMILSTGMSTPEEIDRTYNHMSKRCESLALLNCTSEYPPIYEDINLRFIQDMADRYPNTVIGHSDHTPDLYTCFAAVTMGARIIEKHVILDKQTPGPDQSVSIDFNELGDLVDGIRKIEKAMGHNKRVNEKERAIRTWAFRSVVTTRFIQTGTTITEDMLCTKRPGTGIPAHKLGEIVGKKALTDIRQNTMLQSSDFS